MLPAGVPQRRLVILLSGIFELVLATAVLISARFRSAGLAICAFLVLATPLNKAILSGYQTAAGAPSRSSIFTGNLRMRTPEAWKTADAIAAAIPAKPISPTPRAPYSFKTRSG
jgi:hypothetical protein